MAQFDVTAMSVNLDTGDTTAPRTERVNTGTNVLFRGLSTPWEVEDAYQHFWNRINPSWETDFPVGKDKVLVLRVEEV